MKIEIDNLKYKYDKGFKLNIPKLEINQGEIFGIVGNNGAGKTTLLKLMLDLILPTHGRVLFNKVNIAKSVLWKEYTGAYLDSSYLIPFLTPEEYFFFVANLHKISKARINSKLEAYKSFFNNEILHQKKKLIRNFSTGNKLKIGIVASLLISPNILILDEPLEGLDPTSRSILKTILIDYNKKQNSIIVISSHDINYVSEICTKIVIMESGNIIKALVNNENTLDELKSYFYTKNNS